jgi:hypothetical protein
LCLQRYAPASDVRNVYKSFFRTMRTNSIPVLPPDCTSPSCPAPGAPLPPSVARLVQSGALYESKQRGQESRARLLARKAVEMDPGLGGLLRWGVFAEAA